MDFSGSSDTGLEVSIEEGPLGLRGLIQPGFVLLTVTPLPVVCAAHLDQAEDILDALLEVVGQEGIEDSSRIKNWEGGVIISAWQFLNNVENIWGK